MHVALVYSLADDYLERRGEFRAEHLGLAQSAAERGELLLGGAFDAPADRALLVWDVPDEDVVRRFVDADPYVRNGLVLSWEIRRWNVVVGSVA